MNKTIQNMKVDMELKGFSNKTVVVYLRNVTATAEFFHIQPQDLTTDLVRNFLHHAITVRKLSRSYVNSIYSGLKFYFTVTLNRKWDMKHIPRVKRPSKLPVALSEAQVSALFDHVKNIKHKTMLITAYSAGLRVGELLALRPSDIDSNAKTIRVRAGKGMKERYTLLSNYNLKALRKYYKLYKPKDFLFENSTTHSKLTTRSIQLVFKRAKKELAFPHDATMHSLRHSFATHLIKSGVDIATIQKLLGHADIRTTSIYLHISTPDVIKITSPLDAHEVFHD